MQKEGKKSHHLHMTFFFFKPFTHSSTNSRVHMSFLSRTFSRLQSTSSEANISYTSPETSQQSNQSYQTSTIRHLSSIQNPISPSKISISNSRKPTSTTSHAATPKDIHSGHRRVHVKPINLQAFDGYPHACILTIDAILLHQSAKGKKKTFFLAGPRKARHLYTVFLADRLPRARGYYQ